MKLQLTLALLLFTAVAASAQVGTRNYLDQTGFNGIHPGDTITKIPKEQLTVINAGTGKGDELYSYNNGNALKLTDKIALQKVEINYFHNKVMSISLYFNEADLQAINEYFDKIYGKGETAERYISQYTAEHSELVLQGKTKDGGYKAYISWPDQ
ncbi:hypothetical protein SAMN05216490_3845 [Mucilaginibacter mallensis]|uniref:Uncharacterized protein n=1 Tax=Mucilaginibacter mallensis TaxID=652787 RepID=A0A1H2B102_MUCMA|nr:hypothetical protein [Mucilaginibacter mallensis]SDT51868.1 hypothetical protein SAMN05216490_3845 [Mucilaginibacter mallensis]